MLKTIRITDQKLFARLWRLKIDAHGKKTFEDLIRDALRDSKKYRVFQSNRVAGEGK